MTRKPKQPLTAETMLIVFEAMRHLGNAQALLEPLTMPYDPRPALWKANEMLSAVMGWHLGEYSDRVDEAYRLLHEAEARGEMPERISWPGTEQSSTES